MIAILLACLAIILLASTAPTIGLTTDEQAYMTGADSYARWFFMFAKDPTRALQPANIDTYWSINHEHPPVEKIWSGLVWLATHNTFGEFISNRLGVILLVGLLVALLYWLIGENYGKPAGLFTATALLSMPRFFFHAHLAALDVPVAAASFAVVFIFWKTIDRKGWGWGALWGIVWGLAVGTKLNGIFIFFALIVWGMIFRRNWSMFLRLMIMGGTAILTFLVTWPWLYHQTWTRLIDYVKFHLDHYVIGQWFLGQFYSPPPWYAVLVILFAVVPLTITVLSLAGVARAGNGKQDGGLAWLLIVSALISISPFIFGKSLLYDNERLFMPVFPFLAALAGIGFGNLAYRLEKLIYRVRQFGLAKLGTILLGFALLFPQSLALVQIYPHLLAYYSEGVGGIAGAAKLGFETTYWGESYNAVISFLNTHAQGNDVVWVDDKDHFLFYQKIGLLRQDLHITNSSPGLNREDLNSSFTFENANWHVFQYRQSQYGVGGEQNFLPLKILENQVPVLELQYSGVPLMKLYGKLK